MMPCIAPPQYIRRKNWRVAVILVGIFVLLYVGSVIFITIWH
jgi:hypothetical protein